jgi:hypothetical protein
MMPSPSIYTYSNARHSYRLLAGVAQARIAALHSIAVTRPIQSRYPQVARSHRPMRPSFAASRSRQPLQSNLSKPEPAANPHSARRSAPAYLPRFRALVLFERRPPQRVEGFVMPASKNCTTSDVIWQHRTGSRSPAEGKALRPQHSPRVVFLN